MCSSHVILLSLIVVGPFIYVLGILKSVYCQHQWPLSPPCTYKQYLFRNSMALKDYNSLLALTPDRRHCLVILIRR